MTAKRAIRNRPETLLVAGLLTAVGGYLDAYTYVLQHVFANAQTGNVVLVAIDLAQGLWGPALGRLPAMAAFVLGLAAAQVLATRRARRLLHRPARWVLATEIVILTILGVVGDELTMQVLASVVSFLAALQVSAFRSVGDLAYTNTMATGNLRNLVAEAFVAVVDRDPDASRHVRMLATVLVSFAAGAATGAAATGSVGGHAAWVAALVLAACYLLIALESRAREGRGQRLRS